MKWSWNILFSIGMLLGYLAEIVSWSLPGLAFRFSPGWLVIAIAANVLPWPRSLWMALGFGLAVDVFSPAPFGLTLLSYVSLVVTLAWVRSTWLKQLSALSAFVVLIIAFAVASLPLWLWSIAASSNTFLSPAIFVVPWWQWPVAWVALAMIAAICIRLLPSPYERLV